MPQRRLGVPLDAVRALSDVGDGDRNDLLEFYGQGSVREHLLAELLEGGLDLG